MLKQINLYCLFSFLALASDAQTVLALDDKILLHQEQFTCAPIFTLAASHEARVTDLEPMLYNAPIGKTRFRANVIYTSLIDVLDDPNAAKINQLIEVVEEDLSDLEDWDREVEEARYVGFLRLVACILRTKFAAVAPTCHTNAILKLNDMNFGDNVYVSTYLLNVEYLLRAHLKAQPPSVLDNQDFQVIVEALSSETLEIDAYPHPFSMARVYQGTAEHFLIGHGSLDAGKMSIFIDNYKDLIITLGTECSVDTLAGEWVSLNERFLQALQENIDRTENGVTD